MAFSETSYTTKELGSLDRIVIKKVKVSPIYDPYVRECLLERTLVLSHRLFEVGWPVPFLAAFISPVFPPGPHWLRGGQWANVQPLVLGGSRTVVFSTVGKRSNRYATRPYSKRQNFRDRYEPRFSFFIDVDECETGQHKCDLYCLNYNGGYGCACLPGYRPVYIKDMPNGSCLGKMNRKPFVVGRDN